MKNLSLKHCDQVNFSISTAMLSAGIFLEHEKIESFHSHKIPDSFRSNGKIQDEIPAK